MARTAITTCLLALAMGAASCSVDVGLSDRPSPPPPGATDLVDDLKIAVEDPVSGYDRGRFGTRWKDIDRNGCDQRNDVLTRDLRDVRRRGGCVVIAGALRDPYSGRTITFTKSDADEVEIDHVYPLALAWRMGASEWDEDRRERFANDHGNLLAVWRVPNRQKSDSGPSDWKPQKAFQCAYAAKYIKVAKEYALPVTFADRIALHGLLKQC